jgi:hypothetical protein
MTHTVRTKKRPHEELEVSDREYTDLKRQGLLVEDEAPARKAGQSNASQATTGQTREN